MIYLTEEEKKNKERYLRNCPDSLVKIYQGGKSISDIYWRILNLMVKHEMIVLDLGAGEKGMISLFKDRKLKIIGFDISAQQLKKNRNLTYRVCGDAQQLPFKDECVHIIISQWLVEHLPNPKCFYKESRRILKKSGFLIAVTNSLFCPLMLFNAVMPEFIRDRIKKKALPKEIKEDTFPTYYRANTRLRIKKIAKEVGFETATIKFASDLSFFIFNKTIFAILIIFDQICEMKIFNPMKMHIISICKKGD